MAEDALLGYVVLYRPENRVYPDTKYAEEGAVRAVELLTLPEAEALARRCRDEWGTKHREGVEVVAVHGRAAVEMEKIRLRGGDKAIRIDDLGVWYNESSDRIHVTHRGGVGGFNVAVGSDPKKPGGHPSLYRLLTECLKLVGAPHPPA